MNKTFNQVGVPKVGRSVFDLSYTKKFTGFFGNLYPTMCDEVVPGDIFDINKQIVIRLMPLVSPIMDEVNMYEHTFFVPYRILMTEELGDDGNFEDFIIGGSDGDTDIALPYWTPASTAKYSLWDYFGFHIGIDPGATSRPVDFPKRAYNMIFNEYYRDVDLGTELDITTNDAVLERPWEKDYFTSARPWQQRGTSPALPISGIIDIDGKDADITLHNEGDATNDIVRTATNGTVIIGTSPSVTNDARWGDPSLEVDLASGITFDINDIRLAVQVQKWMERNARAGTRYTEFLNSHFGVTVRDDRLNRPEYIGGLKAPVIISEVLQTSESAATDLGTMGGHGISVNGKKIGKYRVKEYGLIISILSVLPRTSYSQGQDRQWTKNTLYDFYFPEFANLSEQAVLTGELRTTAVPAENNVVFGYQGRHNEMRVKKNIVCSDFAASQALNYWTFAREFAAVPVLNENFIRSRYSAGFTGGIRNTPFAASASVHMMVTVGNIIKAVRPLPIMAMPGYLDHN